MTLVLPGLPWSLQFVAEVEAGDAALEVTAEMEPGGRVGLRLVNGGTSAARVATVRLTAELDALAASGWLWIHGRQMGADALIHNFGDEAAEGYSGSYVAEADAGRVFTSAEVCVVTLPAKSSPTLVIGSLRGDRFATSVRFAVDRDEDIVERLVVEIDVQGIEVAGGQTLELPPLYLAEGSDAQLLIRQYADAVAVEMEARVPERPPTGWCSWYYFYDKVSEADIVANLESMVAEGHPANVVQIDDGYQSATGDWLTPNEKFPSGMAALAGRIDAAGYRPGLWLAPFLLHEESRTLAEQPEMALKRKDGSLYTVDTWLGRCAVLDCSHPAAEARLREVIGTVVSEWGYRYLKLDALAFADAAATDVVYHDANGTGPANLRRGLEIIREAAGEETFILGCTCPFAPAIGLVDAMRVGPDVKAVWADGTRPSVRHAMRMTLQRNWMHGRWWANDPDCLIVRETDTELTEAETRFLATSIVLSGGMVVASDDLPALSDERRAMAMALFPPAGVAAAPLVSSDGPTPDVWRAQLDDERALVGVLNWSDEGQWVSPSEILRPGESGFDVWGAKVLGHGDIYLNAHDATLWQVTMTGPGARVVGDSGHIDYARLAMESVSGRVHVTNESRTARVVAIEAHGQIDAVPFPAGAAAWFD